MAKSFYTTLEEGSFEVKHQHEYVTLVLPEWLVDASDKLDDEESLLEWAQEHEVLHGLMHLGIQQVIIALRAAARPSVNAKTGETKSILTDMENAQKRVDDYVLKPVKKPGSSKKTPSPEEALKVLQASGMTLEDIKAALGQ